MTTLPYNKNLKKYSRELRKNMTAAENLLWLLLSWMEVNIIVTVG